jgi:hypothetical protein
MKKQKQCRFDIDFIEFAFLVEACIPPRPIARAMFWDDVINKYYHVLNENERKRLFEWVQLSPSFKIDEPDCAWFWHRYNTDTQYVVTTDFDGNIEKHDCFLFNKRYYTKKDRWVFSDYITNVEKKYND